MLTMTTNYLHVTQGFEVLTKVLASYVTQELQVTYGEHWWEQGVIDVLYDNQKRDLPTDGNDEILTSTLDVARCLRLIDLHWRDLFGSKLKREHRTWLNELIDTRNKWAHQGSLDMPNDDAWRALDTMTRLVEPMDSQATKKLREIADEVCEMTSESLEARGIEKTRISSSRNRRKRVNKKTTEAGYKNRNNQTVIRKTDLPGNDHNQRVYILQCEECFHNYGANGSDIWLRKCPNCQGGADGLPY
ncbi:MAG: Swt1 family HEPN domain-containing protein [Nitrospinae bacterium]|nr:Swt1 family HEPN domain-containing protein [Nitrospinota bacterium]